jgi:hypothetical protein
MRTQQGRLCPSCRYRRLTGSTQGGVDWPLRRLLKGFAGWISLLIVEV